METKERNKETESEKYIGWFQKKDYTGLDNQLKLANYLWDEYKYRHDLCWKLTFKLTLTVVALGVIPYVKTEIVQHVEYWILITPGLGLLFGVLGLFKLRGELKLWKHIRDLYAPLQEEITVQYPNEKHNISFQTSILGYIWALILLAFLNLIYTSCLWIPKTLCLAA